MSKNTKIAVIVVSAAVLVIILGLLGYIILNPGLHSTSNYRNGLRLTKIRALQSTLELYFDDQKHYPPSLEQIPIKYGAVEPFPIVKINHPACPGQDPYDYHQVDGGNSYLITFCLPESDSRYLAGYHIASPEGIK